MRNKIVSFFLHDACVGQYGDPKNNENFGIKEHLGEYLENGWSVVSLHTLGGAGGKMSGWVIAVLGKPHS